MGTIHEIKVKIKNNSTELDVDPEEQGVGKSKDPIVIVWKFHENFSHLKFGDGNGEPGFAWAPGQASKDFSGPWYSNDDKRIILDDSNEDGSESRHVYRLCAHDGSGNVYRTRLIELDKEGRVLTTNPAIINR